MQQELGLAEDATAPLFAVVSRLTSQKGLDLVLDALPALLKGPAAGGAQLAVLPLKTVPGRGYEIDLPIGSIARGEYVISIEASRGADQARTLVSFRVGSPQQ